MADFVTEIDALLQDDNYRIVVTGISGAKNNGTVVGVVTEDLSMGSSNSFTNTLQSSAVANLQTSISKFQSLAERLGINGLNQISVRTVEQGLDFWTGSERPRFKQSMIFIAQNPGDNVRLPVAALYKTVFPTLNGFGFTDTISPPLGYVPYSAADAKSVSGTIGVNIGKWFRSTGQIMDSVSFKFSKETTTAGNPLYAVGEISFHPYREISWKEMCEYMGVSGST